MRVLWFVNIPLPAVAKKLGRFSFSGSGWWLDATLQALEKYTDIEFGVASVSPEEYSPFSVGRITYFNIIAPKELHYAPRWLKQWKHPIDFETALDQCVDIIERFNPDLIHIHGSEDFFGLMKNRVDYPVLLTIQGILLIFVKQFFHGFTVGDILREILSPSFLKGDGLIHDYWLMVRRAEREREIINSCANFTGQTDFDCDFVVLLNPSAAYYSCDRVLRPAFYTGRWNPEALKKKIIYCVTGPSPYKGLECLLEAIAILKTNGFPDITLRISGQIENTPVGNMLKRRMRKLGLKNEVTWLGSSSPDTIVSELRSASVFVVPSHVENESQALSEALMVGTPCVASYVGGMPTTAQYGKAALMFPDGDSYMLAASVRRILSEPSLALSLFEQACATAAQRHNPQKIAQRMKEIYQDILRRNENSKKTKEL